LIGAQLIFNVHRQACLHFLSLYLAYLFVFVPAVQGSRLPRFCPPVLVCVCRDNYLLAYMASLEAESLDIAYSNLIQTSLMRTMEGFVPNFGR
jgi:hypothetical protein